MANTGWVNAGTGRTYDRGASYDPWTSPTNIISENGSGASGQIVTGLATDYLLASQYSFGLPPACTIDGIKVRIKWAAPFGSGQGYQEIVRLTTHGDWSSGTFPLEGNNKATSADVPETYTWTEYGGASDLWGMTLTKAVVSNSAFGVVLTAGDVAAVYPDVRIDAVQIDVYYTELPGNALFGVWP